MLERFHQMKDVVKYAIVVILGVALISLGTFVANNVAVTGGSILSRDYATSLVYDQENNKTTFELQAKVFNGDHFTMEVIKYNVETLDTLGMKDTYVTEDIPCHILPGQTELTHVSFTMAGEYMSIKILSWQPVRCQNGFQTIGIGYIAATVYYAVLGIIIFIMTLKKVHYRKFYAIAFLIFLLEMAPLALLGVNWYLFYWIETAAMDGFAGTIAAWALGYFIVSFKDAGFENPIKGGTRKHFFRTLEKYLSAKGYDARVNFGGITVRYRGKDSYLIDRPGYRVFLDSFGAGVFGGKDSKQEYIEFPLKDNYVPSTPHGRAFINDFPTVIMNIKLGLEKETGAKLNAGYFFESGQEPVMVEEKPKPSQETKPKPKKSMTAKEKAEEEELQRLLKELNLEDLSK